jgi:hypothetical protein
MCNFLRIAIQFSEVPTLFYLPKSKEQYFQFLHIFANIGYLFSVIYLSIFDHRNP